jgi:rSAM/selenodomain-associated transferase 1
MAKHPRPGRVKTRLAAAFGPEAACALQRAFLVDLAARLAETGWATTWAVSPPDAPFGDVLPGARWIGQRGADLGARMDAATTDLFAEGPGPVLVLGADAPHAALDELRAAAAALEAGSDVALGPARDGGYWLVGLRAPTPALFADVPWGTDSVLRTTLARAETLHLGVRLVAPTFDVDEPADVRRLHELLVRGDIVLPETTRVLARLTDFTDY